jgi:hypothetical protein
LAAYCGRAEFAEFWVGNWEDNDGIYRAEWIHINSSLIICLRSCTYSIIM